MVEPRGKEKEVGKTKENSDEFRYEMHQINREKNKKIKREPACLSTDDSDSIHSIAGISQLVRDELTK